MAGSGKRAVIAVRLFEQECGLSGKVRRGTDGNQYPAENKQLDYF
jgi:hypothetical protein